MILVLRMVEKNFQFRKPSDSKAVQRKGKERNPCLYIERTYTPSKIEKILKIEKKDYL